MTIFSFCHQANQTPALINASSQIITVDSTLQDSIQCHIQLISDRHFSQFKSPAEIRFFTNDLIVDSIVEKNAEMISWYTIYGDSTDLVVHFGEGFGTTSLLLRFLDSTIHVYYFIASHEGQRFFRLNKKDSLMSQAEVPASNYKLYLAQKPDKTRKQPVYGYIEMKSSEYLVNQKSMLVKCHIEMKFYFRSQYKKFNF